MQIKVHKPSICVFVVEFDVVEVYEKDENSRVVDSLTNTKN